MRKIRFLFSSALALVSRQAALRGAIRRNDVFEVAKLIRDGALNKSGLLAGERPLVLAIRLGRSRMIRILLESGADPLENQGAAIRVAADNGNTSALEALLTKLGLRRKCNLEYQTKMILDAGLHAAAIAGHPKICRMLIESGASVDARDGGDDGYTSLMYATMADNIEVVQLLITFGADVNLVMANGWTPLMAAAARCHIEVLTTLIAAGANLNHQNRHGATALDHARLVGCEDAIEQLTKPPKAG